MKKHIKSSEAIRTTKIITSEIYLEIFAIFFIRIIFAIILTIANERFTDTSPIFAFEKHCIFAQDVLWKRKWRNIAQQNVYWKHEDFHGDKSSKNYTYFGWLIKKKSLSTARILNWRDWKKILSTSLKLPIQFNFSETFHEGCDN